MMFWCKNCVMPSTRPRIEFNDNDICNACEWHAKKQTIVDWPSRWNILEAICDRFRGINGNFDCIIPASGGKDSSYIAMQFKEVLGMHPLTVTFAHPLPTRLGWQNWNNFVATGFDNILITPKSENYKRFARDSFISQGLPKQPFVCGISTAIIKIAKQMDIKLICFAEQGEVEYGGKTNTQHLQKFNRDFLVNIYYEGQKNINNYGPWWEIPTNEDFEDLHVTWFSLFEDWDPQEHAIFAKQKCNMQMHVGGNIGTFTNYAQNEDMLQDLHMYLCYIKYGFGRCSADVSIEIRRSRMTREQGVKIVNELDGLFPLEYLDAYLDYFDMTEKEFWKIIDKWANQKLMMQTNKPERPWILKEKII